MFVFTSKMKLLAGSLTLVGLVFLLIGFNTDYSSHADSGDHGAVAQGHESPAPATEAHADEAQAAEAHATEAHANEAHAAEAHATEAHAAEGHATEAHAVEGHADEAHASEHGHDLSANRPWAAFLVNSIFFLGIGIGTLFFLAIQYAAQVGWSVGLIRVFEAVSMFVGIPILGILFLIATEECTCTTSGIGWPKESWTPRVRTTIHSLQARKPTSMCPSLLCGP